MPRKNPVPKEAVAEARRMRELRDRLKLTRVQFAQIIGVDSNNVSARDHARVPWKPEELHHVKTALEDHLEASLDAVREVLG